MNGVKGFCEGFTRALPGFYSELCSRLYAKILNGRSGGANSQPHS